MDDRTFDGLTKALASGTSRRRLVKGVLAGAVGGAVSLAGTFGVREAAAVCKAYGQTCVAGAECCTGFCAATKRCRCPAGTGFCNGACQPASAFQSDPNNCGGCNNRCASTGTCTNGICSVPACAPAGGYGPGVSTGGLPCGSIKFTWTAQPGTDFYVISIDGVAQPPTTGTTLTVNNLPHKAVGSYQYCFQQGKNSCPDLSVPVCGSFNTRGCAP